MTATYSITIADAGERIAAFRRARMNSVVVRVLRWVLPVCACVLLSSYVLFMQRTIRIENKNHVGKLNTGTIATLFDNLAMTDPSYEGYNKKDGSRYRVSAKKAITDLSREKPVELHDIDGTFRQATGEETAVRAKRGMFDQNRGTLDLAGGIRVKGPNGVMAALNSANINTRTSEITSAEPVLVELPGAEVRSNAMRLNQRAREILFRDGVAAKLRPEANKSAAKPGAPPKPAAPGVVPGFGSSAPVDITSATLAIFDQEHRAVFNGNVRAIQEGRTLEAPNLAVFYEGGGSASPLVPEAAAAEPDAARRQLRQIVASSGVRLTQDGSQALAREAVFHVALKKAELKGDVKITAAAGRSIDADHAAIDTATNRVVLTGKVVARQEQNLLRGSRMIYEPKLGRMHLASPALDGAPGGDIFVRFRSPTPAGGRKSKQKTPTSGITFNTNPEAPVEVIARSLDVEDPRSIARFEGNVRARQGDFTLTTPVLTAHYDGQIGLAGDPGTSKPAAKAPPMKLRLIQATNPVVVTSGDDMKAEGDAAEFDMVANTVTISGNVILKRGRQIVHGDTLVIDLKTGQSRMKNSGPRHNDRKPLTFGSAPQISSTRGSAASRACGGQMCAVIYPQEYQKAQEARKQGAQGAAPGGQPKSKLDSGWSASTRTN